MGSQSVACRLLIMACCLLCAHSSLKGGSLSPVIATIQFNIKPTFMFILTYKLDLGVVVVLLTLGFKRVVYNDGSYIAENIKVGLSILTLIISQVDCGNNCLPDFVTVRP